MSQKTDLSKYPLPEALTHRVLTYLIYFRLLISVLLLYALFAGLVSSGVWQLSIGSPQWQLYLPAVNR